MYQVGDNLVLLRGLADASVDMVYMDPPYNTGRDFYYFSDKHEDFVAFMRDRIREHLHLIVNFRELEFLLGVVVMRDPCIHTGEVFTEHTSHLILSLLRRHLFHLNKKNTLQTCDDFLIIALRIKNRGISASRSWLLLLVAAVVPG